MVDPLTQLDRMAKERQLTALQFRWRGGYTRRYHALRNIMEDTVGHHSFNVAAIIRFIAADLPLERYHLLICAALDHDVAECVVGDMPAPAKRRLPNYSEAGEASGLITFREVFADMEGEVMNENGMDDIGAHLNEEEAKLLKAADAMDGMRFCLQEIDMGNRLAIPTYDAFFSYVKDLDLLYESRAYGLFATLLSQRGAQIRGRQ